IAERGTISPRSDGAQNHPILVGTTSVEDEGTIDMAVGSDDEADTHVHIVVLTGQRRIGSEQGLGRTNVATFRQGERLGHGRELGDMSGNAPQVLFQFRERGSRRNRVRTGGLGGPNLGRQRLCTALEDAYSTIGVTVLLGVL